MAKVSSLVFAAALDEVPLVVVLVAGLPSGVAAGEELEGAGVVGCCGTAGTAISVVACDAPTAGAGVADSPAGEAAEAADSAAAGVLPVVADELAGALSVWAAE
ncbi:MAG TPA: hypothetical protein VF614_06350 [Chthoniobacteraceae bacterium]|jgi:hypothetical protein